jgi:hypothetical protein
MERLSTSPTKRMTAVTLTAVATNTLTNTRAAITHDYSTFAAKAALCFMGTRPTLPVMALRSAHYESVDLWVPSRPRSSSSGPNVGERTRLDWRERHATATPCATLGVGSGSCWTSRSMGSLYK